jgi:hypothetical protein
MQQVARGLDDSRLFRVLPTFTVGGWGGERFLLRAWNSDVPFFWQFVSHAVHDYRFQMRKCDGPQRGERANVPRVVQMHASQMPARESGHDQCVATTNQALARPPEPLRTWQARPQCCPLGCRAGGRRARRSRRIAARAAQAPPCQRCRRRRRPPARQREQRVKVQGKVAVEAHHELRLQTLEVYLAMRCLSRRATASP